VSEKSDFRGRENYDNEQFVWLILFTMICMCVHLNSDRPKMPAFFYIIIPFHLIDFVKHFANSTPVVGNGIGHLFFNAAQFRSGQIEIYASDVF
jgi:hypothetical protein